jgi:hypothetical protein
MSPTPPCSGIEERSLRAEDSLLFACASAAGSQRDREELREWVQQCQDWNYVVETARQHGITALVSSRLDQTAADLVPTNPLETLRGRFRANAARNLFLTHELLSLVREFATHGIDVIPLKGPLLAITTYGNVALREFLDLDILVPKQHLTRAAGVLTRRGYQPAKDQTGEFTVSHIESRLGCDFHRLDGKASVELHWSFLQRWLGFDFELSTIWEAPKGVDVGGTRVLTMTPETTLLYLCAHGTKHRWSRLCWIVDIAQLLRAAPDLKVEELLRTATRTGSRRTLFLGLHLAQKLLGSELPPRLRLEMEADASARNLAKKLCAGYFTAAVQSLRNGECLARDWFYLSTKERMRDRARYLRYLLGWLLLPSQKDRDWAQLPASLNWLYLILRPIRVASVLFGRTLRS